MKKKIQIPDAMNGLRKAIAKQIVTLKTNVHIVVTNTPKLRQHLGLTLNL